MKNIIIISLIIILFINSSFASLICNSQIDLLLLINSGSNISPITFNSYKSYLVEFINLFNITENNVNVGIISYATELNIELNISNSKENVISSIQNIKQRFGKKGYTNIQSSLNIAQIESLNTQNRRPGIPFVTLLYLNSYPTTNNRILHLFGPKQLMLRKKCIQQAQETMQTSLIISTAIMPAISKPFFEPFLSKISNKYFFTNQYDIYHYSQNNPTYFEDICYLTNIPTLSPIGEPTLKPTKMPSQLPTNMPTNIPTKQPTYQPTYSPTIPIQSPTKSPTSSPTLSPLKNTSSIPTSSPTLSPSQMPTFRPTKIPTKLPSLSPTKMPVL